MESSQSGNPYAIALNTKFGHSGDAGNAATGAMLITGRVQVLGKINPPKQLGVPPQRGWCTQQESVGNGHPLSTYTQVPIGLARTPCLQNPGVTPAVRAQ